MSQISEKALIFIGNLIGAPYERDSYDGVSFDCWSLIWYIYLCEGVYLPKRDEGTWTPRNVVKQIREWQKNWVEVRFGEHQYMDVLLFATSGNMTTHVGMVLDKSRFIHTRDVPGVVVGRVNKGQFSVTLKKVYRCKLLMP